MRKRDKVEAIGALGGSALLGIFVSPVIGIAAAGLWGTWRIKRWRKRLRDQAAQNRGYKNYQEFLNKN